MGGSSSSGDPAGPISLNGVDLNADVKKTVPDFEATKQRLQSVDFQSAIDSDSLFEDPHFPADRDSILDKRMSHEGLSKWESFVCGKDLKKFTVKETFAFMKQSMSMIFIKEHWVTVIF